MTTPAASLTTFTTRYLFAICSLAASPVFAETLALYDFDDQSSIANTLAASNPSSALYANGAFSVSDGAFTSTAFNSPLPPDGGFAVADSGSWSAVTPTKFFSFVITPLSGASLFITGIRFDYRQTAAGALNFQIDVGASTNVASGVFTRDSAWRSEGSISLSGLTEITSATQVKIFGFGGGAGSFAIDQVELTGTATAIPEPSAFGLLAGMASLGWVSCRTRHRAGRV